jgi:hypothetical protein
MVRRRNGVDVNRLRIRARGYRAMSIAANVDRFAGEPAFKARPLNLRRSCGTDPGPAGFDWVEIDFSSAPLANGRDDS